jgi:dipeptidyl aminopeptidase/acylaminoacyl peptidase
LTPDLQASAEPLPLEYYAAIARASGARLSPDGKNLALIGSVNGHPELVIWPLDGGKPKSIPADAQPNWVIWKTDRRLLVSLRFKSERFAPNRFQKTDLVSETRLYGFDVDGGNPEEIGHAANMPVARFLDQVVSTLPDDPNHILQVMPGRDPRVSSVAKTDITSGSRVGGYPDMPGVTSFMADPQGSLRLLVKASNNNNSVDSLVRDDESADWRSILRIDPLRESGFTPVAFDKRSPAILFVLSDYKGGPAGLYEFDTRTMQIGKEIAYSQGGDIVPLVHEGALVGYVEPDGKSVYVDPDFAADAAVAEGVLPGRHVIVIDRSRDGKRALLSIRQGNQPEEYWLLDRTGPKVALTGVLQTYDQIPASGITRTRLESYKARDGLTIPVLVTVPEGNGPFPFVVLPHDGPMAQDGLDSFDVMVQFLANRGYGVLQPQYRGSTGWGGAYIRAGFDQWGKAIGDDVTDGARWAIEHKLADPNRLCIVGKGFGGFTALSEAEKNPSLYRCVATIGALTDLPEWRRRFHGQAIYQQRVYADSRSLFETDFGTLADLSPTKSAEKIASPVLLIHGREDLVIPISHSEQMEAALRDKGKAVETLYLDAVDHNIEDNQARQAVFRKLADFLQNNLGTRQVAN